ncbi:glutamate synthase large subunit [Candidatus Epulonipiscium viviparus]|uniref:glutamate synthase large subunit n=1 Tax=Candidatus Epulonipiscium viviparus TaxID=420336 RepID=UPI002738136C|nr:glutamate synthase large subunit [Candidatus Epulopiscium viviparus]
MNGLYSEQFEHDNCGIGAVVDIFGNKTHKTVQDSLRIVEHLEHRAGKDASGETGDGVGIMVQVGHKFFTKECNMLGLDIGNERDYGVGMIFFTQDTQKRAQEQKLFEMIVRKEGGQFIGWREVPVNPDVLGHVARECMPSIWQPFIRRPKNIAKGLDFDRQLYIIRRVFEQAKTADTYVCSMSSRTIVYKGMFLVKQLGTFYLDLMDPTYESAMGMVHSRFSTNTLPSWKRAHPNRFIMHNGEINTINGNVDLMIAREETVCSEYADTEKTYPIVDSTGSDSAMLDNALEFMVMNGMTLPKAVMTMIPEPWANTEMSRLKRDFYAYYATMIEPWDGPAAVVFCDGDILGAILDRNGLRPSRYYVTKDNRLILSSEVGVLQLDDEEIEIKDRLHPGKMLLVDLNKQALISDTEIKDNLAAAHPYGEWLDKNLVTLASLPIPPLKPEVYPTKDLATIQKAFGYSYEDVREIILPMAKNAIEPTGAMGDDTPIAPLSKNHPKLSSYFKQRFAQVTNPPIDAIREKVVTDTSTYIGARGNILIDTPDNCRVLKVNNPILTEIDLIKIQHMNKPGFVVKTISLLYYKNQNLDDAIQRLCIAVDRAYRDNANVIILSDRGVDEYRKAIPSLLATAAISSHLIITKKRTAIALILETAEPRDVHDFATLLGYGACAVNPYLAHQTIRNLVDNNVLIKDYYVAVSDYNKAVIDGIVKIASKMGISTIQSYQGSKIFEAIGLSSSLVNKYFIGTISRIEGIDINDIDDDVTAHHEKAFDPLALDTLNELPSAGVHKMRAGAEQHLYTPDTLFTLQRAVQTGNYDLFKEYTSKVNTNVEIHLRNLFDFNFAEDGGIDINEVEDEYQIVKRFSTGPMSYGSLSAEAHETLAIAMNNLGAKSNTGEGGEAPERFGTNKNSKVKQVASARFGVTSKYLVSAEEIQIKIAQGAKPGEGGHLPGAKVYPWIAKTRHSISGVGLISPPPHHDIYSIEDLAQLIFDLKNANTNANISVKLVSDAGVGTVAAGVAKAGAGHITISGYDGGTGAAPKTSIINAGMPWELGVAEVHQTLVLNQLRDKIQLEADSKMMSGRDLAIAAILGAEQFSFATGALIALGCVMMRVCNLDTCPMGIATQNPVLRERFAGKPEYVENFMLFMARDLREYMARLGVRSVKELTGHVEFLRQKTEGVSARAKKLDLSKILYHPEIANSHQSFNPAEKYNFELENTTDLKTIVPHFADALETATPKFLELKVDNQDRTLGTIFGSHITRKFGDTLPHDTFTIKCLGSIGQSVGAFIPAGLTIEIEGDANDYLGKGLSGGKIIVYPKKNVSFDKSTNIVIGNVALYGATSGRAYIWGSAGERFAVRNSGAQAVVEGVGDHCCEYMTGGIVVVLGHTGKNFAAGMSGGTAYVLDEHNDLYLRVNKAMVSIDEITDKHDKQTLKQLISNHYHATGSNNAKKILDNFEAYLPKFKKILPHDYDKMIKQIGKMMETGLDVEQAEIEAFYNIKRG